MESDFRVLIERRVERREAVLKELKRKKQDIIDNHPEKWTIAIKFEFDKLEKDIDFVEGEIIEILLQAKRYNKGE